MKRTFSLLLIALLLIFPVFSAHAEDGTYVYVDDGILTADELAAVNTRAAEIASERGVGIYYFFYEDVKDLPSYIEQFAAEHVVEDNALVLGFNAEYYYFLQIGPIAEAALPDSVCDTAILDAYRAVKGDPKNKLLAYLNAADDALTAYFANQSESGASTGTDGVPGYIAPTDGGKPTLVDREHLLTDSQAEALSKRLKEIGTTYRCDVVVVTVPRLDGKSSEAYADDFFDYNGYGYGATPDANGTTINGDGILLLISMEARDFAISTSGYAIKAFTDYGIQEYLEPQFLPYLSGNDFNSGFNAFADGCEYLLKTARESIPYDCRHIYVDSWTDAQLLGFNDRAASVANAEQIGIYYLESETIADAGAFLSDFRRNRAFESNTVLLVKGTNGYVFEAHGDLVKSKFTDSRIQSVLNEVTPYLENGDTYGAVGTYLDLCEKIARDYNHVLTGEDAIYSATLRNANDRLRQLYQEHGVALYFLSDSEANDPDVLARTFLDSGMVYESNAVVFGTNGSACSVAVKGNGAKDKFTERRIARLQKEVAPYLNVQDLNGALNAFAERSEKILNWRPVNWLTFGIAVIAGLLFGGIPVSTMKRQMTSIARKTSAEGYMEPSSFTMLQNDDVLLGQNVSRSVHVVHSDSGGGGRSGGGGSSFHGGSSTHSSSSGGTHGGHSGKF